MAVIVTGATGFIGSHLAQALAAAGEEVRCLVRRPGPVSSPAGSRFYLADFSVSDLAVPNSVCESVDTIYHVAGATRAVSTSAFHEANVAITQRLLARAAQGGARPRFVYISSQAAAGPTPEGKAPLSEDDPPVPIEAYGRSKLEAERALSAWSILPFTIVRPVAVYGPRDRDFLSMFRLVRRGIAIYPGIRDATVTTIFVGDLVRGIIAAANAPAAMGGTYFMGHAQAATWQTIYRSAGEIAGRSRLREVDIPLPLVRIGALAGDLFGRLTRHPLLLTNNKAALAAPRFWTCSSARAQRDFAWIATTSLHDGLRSTYDWYLRHQWL